MIQVLKNWIRKEKVLVTISILIFSLVLILPQIITKGVITGSDFLFHYNRFYETAMQLKSGNFSYFISLYGFNSSGRIVNALYGPYFAYLQGFLVLLSKNWFTYQLVSRFLLSTIAGLSMYTLVRRVSVKPKIALFSALFYMTTFSIQYWTFRQGFSSWGAAFMPWCLIPAIDFVRTQKVRVLRLAIAVALMVQVHMLSAFLLIVAYLPFYLYGFSESKEKLRVIGQGMLAVALALVLDGNIWGAILEVGSGNNLVEPFINSNLYIMTVNQRSIQWLITPLPLVLLIGYLLYFSFRHWRHYDSLLRVVTATFFLFLVLSSSIFPWYTVNKLNLSLVNLIQFPFRFFVPTTIFLILGIALVLERYFEVKWKKWVTIGLTVTTCFSSGQILYHQVQPITQFLQSKNPIKDGKHQFVWGDADEVRASLYDEDLFTLLDLVSKSTPDYLPSDKSNTDNKYALYEKYVLEYTDDFQKAQEDGKLIFTWTAENEGQVNIPIAKYANTELVLNGKKLSEKDFSLSGIGTPRVEQVAGQNKLEITYSVGRWFTYIMGLHLLSWSGLLVYGIFRVFKRKHLLGTR